MPPKQIPARIEDSGAVHEGTLHCRLPIDLLTRFTEMAEKCGVNRSQLLRGILQTALGDPDTELAIQRAISLSTGAGRRMAAIAITRLPDMIRSTMEGELRALEEESEQSAPTTAALDRQLADWRKRKQRARS